MGYFKTFRSVAYKFGNEDDFTRFQELSAYADVLDTIKNDVNFYQKYTYLENERPDTVSQKLYGTPNYYWTFYFMNDTLKEHGWANTSEEIIKRAQKEYPYTTLTTSDEVSQTFTVGKSVFGLTTGATGTIISRRLGFGQLIVDTEDTFLDGEIIIIDDGVYNTTVNVVEQYNSIHHYEDSSAEYVDVSPFDTGPSIYTPITFLEYMQEENDKLRTINVLKPNVVTDVVAAFNEAMRR